MIDPAQFSPSDDGSRRRATNRACAITGLLLATVALIELLGFFQEGRFAILAAWSWIGLGLLGGAMALGVIGLTVLHDLRNGRFLGCLSLGFAAILTFWGCAKTEVVSINSEATQQVATGLQNLRAPDFAQNQLGFLGYPRRQYTVAALPAAVMGRSLLALRLGFALPFFLGILLFYAGLQAVSGRGAAFVPAVGTALIFCFPPVTHWLRQYEQTILPLAFTLQATGWWLLATGRKIPPSIAALALAWCGSQLAAGYTPGLAALCLLIALLAAGYLMRAQRTALPPNPILIAGLLGFLVVSGGIALHLQWDARFQMKVLTSGLEQKAGDGMLRPFFPLPAEGQWLAAIFYLLWLAAFAAFAFALAFGRSGRSRPLRRMVGIWSIATMLAAVFLAGYAPRSAIFDFHRAMVVAPPLSALAALSLGAGPLVGAGATAGWLRRNGQPLAVLALLAAAGFLAIGNLPARWVPRSEAAPVDALIVDTSEFLAERGLAPEMPFEIVAAPNLVPIHTPDYLSYFFPRARFHRTTRQGLGAPDTFRVRYRRLVLNEPPPPDSVQAPVAVLRLRTPTEYMEILRTTEGSVPPANPSGD